MLQSSCINPSEGMRVNDTLPQGQQSEKAPGIGVTGGGNPAHPTVIQRFFAPNYDVNNSARLYQSHYSNVWDSERDKDRHPRWIDSMPGRFGVRLFSRGLMGASFLTAGSWMLEKYIPASSLSRSIMKNGQIVDEWAALKESDKTKYFISKILAVPAKFYDVTFGKPIGYLFGEDYVRFRRSRNFNPDARASNKMGRSYGEEAVNVTLDFAMGSIGDAWGRRLVGIADPNVKKEWIDKDGHIDWGKLAKATGRAAFDILSYNQMEDWFAAIPYVYQMRAQRHVLDSKWAGSRVAMDHNLNGGGFRVDHTGKIIDDYALAGAIDLQLRFMGYNVYTLMFRDLYQHAKHMLDHRKDVEKPGHERNVLEEVGKYLMKTFVKANTYMLPSVPFFWAMRTSHSRLEAPRIYVPEQGTARIVEFQKHGTNNVNVFRSQDRYRHPDRTDVGLRSETNPKKIDPIFPKSVTDREYLNPDWDPFHPRYNSGSLTAALRPLGKASAYLGEKLGDAVTTLRLGGNTRETASRAKSDKSFWDQRNELHRWSQRFVNNSLSYTPYMIAKYEAANWWDTPQMDASIYRVLDGIDHFKGHEVKEGLKDFWHVIQRKPVSAETELMTHEQRGLINSQRQGADVEKKRDGLLNKSFADVQLENKIARRKAVMQAKHSQKPILVDEATAAHVQQAFSSDAATPTNAVRPRDEKGWAAHEIQRMQQRNGPNTPQGVTIH